MDPGEVARRIVDRFRPAADAKGLDLSLGTVADGAVPLDAGLVGQVLWNLVDNAVKFTPSGGEVRVDVERRRGALEIAVRDTGPGLGDRPERVFDRFVRLDPARTRGEDTSGTGLGLSIVRAIVEGFGGRVTAANAADGGAVFRAIMPWEPQGGERSRAT
jgi:signal transduction histidine kinase